MKRVIGAVAMAVVLLADFKGCAPERGKVTFTNEPYDPDARCEGRVMRIKNLPDGARALWYLDGDCKKQSMVILSRQEVESTLCGDSKRRGTENEFWPDCSKVNPNPGRGDENTQ